LKALPSTPGYCGAQDTFYVGTMKGVGRIHQQTLIDTYAEVAFAKLCTAPGSLDKWLAYAARLSVCSFQAARAASGLRWPFFSISHSAL
jgi:hypothetical protein